MCGRLAARHEGRPGHSHWAGQNQVRARRCLWRLRGGAAGSGVDCGDFGLCLPMDDYHFPADGEKLTPAKRME